MAQALYRKYRSKKLDEIVGQKPITTALNNAIKNGQISHAYLFTGPRGVGKTSVARILAHEINNIPYTSDQLPMDIIEIDAASNRRIDEIRDLREKVNIAPVSAKFKVYIIDEVHMLTREAFNALLKTLEEPPAHVIFILATTEAHKLPETIISRTQRYSFRLASTEEVAAHLKFISDQEKIDIDEESLELIAKHSGGSLRDALSLLDQIRHSANKITADLVKQNLGLPSGDLVSKLLAAISADDPMSIVNELRQAQDDGASSSLIAEQLLQELRQKLISKESTFSIEDNLNLVKDLLEVESSSRPDIQLEIALISAQLRNQKQSKPTISQTEMTTISPPLTISEPAKRLKTKSDVIETVSTVSEPIASSDTSELTPEVWATALAKIKQTHNTIYGILRMAEPKFDNIDKKEFVLVFRFPFHQKRMKESKNMQVIANTLSGIGITGINIICDISPIKKDEIPEILEPLEVPDELPPENNNLVDQVRNIFGGAEVLE